MSARKTERLLNLVICLLATRRYLSAEQIRRTVAGYEDLGDEAFKRKFERDKEDLRDLGIPLETGSDSPFDDEPGYRIRRDDYNLPEIAFEPAELAVLGVAARTWQHASLGGQAFEAILKLRAAGVDIDDAVPVAIETRVATSEPAFEPLRQAATDRRPVTFDYRTPGATRHVDPWGLVSWHGRWYLAAYDTDRAATRVFRLSRIVGTVEPSGAAVSLTHQFDAIPERLHQRHWKGYRRVMQTGHTRYRESDVRGQCGQSATGRTGKFVSRAAPRPAHSPAAERVGRMERAALRCCRVRCVGDNQRRRRLGTGLSRRRTCSLD